MAMAKVTEMAMAMVTVMPTAMATATAKAMEKVFCNGNGVGRRGTNQLCLLERYLDVLLKHTTEILPPTALVEVCP